MIDYDETSEDVIAGDGISELERRHDLTRRRQAGVQVAIDLVETSTFNAYVKARRDAAKEALVTLATIDARDAVGIVRAQGIVSEFLAVRDWARGMIEDASLADNELQELPGDSDDDQDA